MFLLAVLAVLLASSVILLRSVYSYWQRRGFPYSPPSIPFGCLGPVAVQKQSLGEVIRDVYLRTKSPFVGIYLLFRPSLLIRDPALVKRVLISDSDHFLDRGVHYDEENDPIMANLVGMSGNQWKDLRAKLSPTFRSGKLKEMFRTIGEKTPLLKARLDEVSGTGEIISLKTSIEHFIVSILASIFFGFEFDAFENPDHEFVKMGRLTFEAETLRSRLAFLGFFLLPNVMKTFKLAFLSKQVSKYAMNLVEAVVEKRKTDPTSVRDDFIQIIMDLMDAKYLDLKSSTAEAFLFYGAGMETTSMTVTFCIWELSRCPEWMQKVQAEVDALMLKREGNPQYEDLMEELKVLDMCIHETLRKYPGLPILNRQCTKDYRIPDTDLVVPKGMSVIVGVLGMHMDQKFYSNPETFDPSRFAKGASAEDLPYYPMGAGPRYCLGARLGFLMTRMTLCTLIHRYEFVAIDEEIKFKPGSGMISDQNGVRVRIERRN